MSEYELKKIGMNKFRLTVDEEMITVAFFSELKFGVEQYYDKYIVNFEISVKIEKFIKEIEKFIFNNFPFTPYSSIRRNKNNLMLKPTIRTYLKYKNKILKTIVKNKSNNVLTMKNIKKTDKLKVHIYLDHIWTKENTIGLCWYIDLIDVL